MKKSKHPENNCQNCNGTGHAPDQVATGARLRKLRVAAGLKQIDVADAMQVTNSYLSDLEKGRRNWSARHIAAYEHAVALMK